jgi:cytochrome c biogenesis protein CcmG/thiol:disulfide interchange protein DsbE
MNHRHLCACIAATLLAAFLTPGTFAQGKSDQPAKSPAAKAPEKDAAKIIEQARAAITAIKAVSYRAEVIGAGGLEGKTPAYTADVTAVRAEAGGWKVYAKGHTSGGPKDAPPDEASSFEVGYDGVTARAIRVKDKSVVEKTVLDMKDLGVFFSGQSARQPIAWELLEDKPLAAEKPEFIGVEKVAGVACDVVKLPAPSDTQPEGHMILHLGVDDHLPRRITRSEPAQAQAAASRILTLKELKTDSNVVSAVFTLAVPDGYRVRTEATPRRARQRDPNAPGGAPPRNREPAGPLAVGSDAPDFALKDAEGKEHKLADYKGKVVFLDFWATWCPPCREAMPSVQKLHDHFKDKPVAVFGVNMNDRADPVKYMKDKGFTYGCLLKGEKIANNYRVSGIPAFFIIGTDGKILWSGSGFPQNDQAAEAHTKKIIDTIEAHLNGKG